jgi:hypothetical protein
MTLKNEGRSQSTVSDEQKGAAPPRILTVIGLRPRREQQLQHQTKKETLREGDRKWSPIQVWKRIVEACKRFKFDHSFTKQWKRVQIWWNQTTSWIRYILQRIHNPTILDTTLERRGKIQLVNLLKRTKKTKAPLRERYPNLSWSGPRAETPPLRKAGVAPKRLSYKSRKWTTSWKGKTTTWNIHPTGWCDRPIRWV